MITNQSLTVQVLLALLHYIPLIISYIKESLDMLYVLSILLYIIRLIVFISVYWLFLFNNHNLNSFKKRLTGLTTLKLFYRGNKSVFINKILKFVI